MENTASRASGQPTRPKAPARSMSAKPPPRPANPPKGEATGQAIQRPQPSPAHAALAGALLGLLQHLADAQEHTRALQAQLRGLDGELDGATAAALDLTEDLAFLGHEAIRCVAEVTGLDAPRSILAAALDLSAVVRLMASSDPSQRADDIGDALYNHATAHFRRT